MKVGLIARGEDRGLGIQTWEWARAMRPDRVLLVDMGDWARGFHCHAERFPGALRLRVTPGWELPETAVREWLTGLDVVYTVETFYDRRIPEWAADVGCATVRHVNPEFWRPEPDWPEATVLWAPTSWRLAELPATTRLVPVPIPTDRWPTPPEPTPSPVRWYHPAGHRALGDRNGTLAVFQALRRVRRPLHMTIATQDPRLPHQGRLPNVVQLDRRAGNQVDYWRCYDRADVVVIPRRYGGLCLPALEAMGAGKAVVMTEASPQADDWPAVVRLPSAAGRSLDVQAGRIVPVDMRPTFLAQLMDEWAAAPERVDEARRRAYGWAQAHSWRRLADTIRGELHAARDALTAA